MAISVENQKISHAVYFAPPLKEFPGVGYCRWQSKN